MTATRDDVVLLRLPVRADLLVLARITAATVASRVGLAFEEIEDLRLAVEELCLSVVGGTASGSVQLTFHSEPRAVRVDCAISPVRSLPSRWVRPRGRGRSLHEDRRGPGGRVRHRGVRRRTTGVAAKMRRRGCRLMTSWDGDQLVSRDVWDTFVVTRGTAAA